MGIVKPLTIRQKKFVNALVEDATSATKAAMKAGYSTRSARTIASRLLQNDRVQSVLEQHFVDEQEYVSKILKNALRFTVTDENVPTKERTKAAKLGLEYTRLASGILGLDMKKRPKPFEDVEPTTCVAGSRVPNVLLTLAGC